MNATHPILFGDIRHFMENNFCCLARSDHLKKIWLNKSMGGGGYWSKSPISDLFIYVFITGRHRCIGENFAYVQIKTIWSTLLRLYDFDLVDGYFPTINYTTMIHTPHNPIIAYKRRKHWRLSRKQFRCCDESRCLQWAWEVSDYNRENCNLRADPVRSFLVLLNAAWKLCKFYCWLPTTVISHWEEKCISFGQNVTQKNKQIPTSVKCKYKMRFVNVDSHWVVFLNTCTALC